MNKCKWEDCSNEARSKSPFCSGTCKKRHARRYPLSGTDVPVEVGQEASGTEVGQPCEVVNARELIVSLAHYQSNPDKYATRTSPHLLNWDEPMKLHELEAAGLKANRVPIPGDWDYSGECEPDGKWKGVAA